MTLADLVVITGMPGIYKVTGKRKDGLIVTSLVDDKATFVSARTHMFTTLDNITIYTSGDGISLKSVFAEMKKQEVDNPTSAIKSDDDLRAYVGKVIPDYDREKVYLSDMRKLVKWYDLLNDKKLIDELIGAADTDTTVAAESENANLKQASTEENSKHKRELKPKAEKVVKAATKPAPAAKKVTAPRKAQ